MTTKEMIRELKRLNRTMRRRNLSSIERAIWDAEYKITLAVLTAENPVALIIK